jgi:hypothetical protein
VHPEQPSVPRLVQLVAEQLSDDMITAVKFSRSQKSMNIQSLYGQLASQKSQLSMLLPQVFFAFASVLGCRQVVRSNVTKSARDSLNLSGAK